LIELSLLQLSDPLLAVKLIPVYRSYEVSLLKTPLLDLIEGIALLLHASIARHLLLARRSAHLDFEEGLRDLALQNEIDGLVHAFPVLSQVERSLTNGLIFLVYDKEF